MNIQSADLVFFSPTGSTKTIVGHIGQGLDAPTFPLDLTLSAECGERLADGEIAVIGVPVYAGRVPALAAARLRQGVRGDGRAAVLVVVYGNRAFEDALLELRDLARELGFVPVAAAAFVGEHSYSTPEAPVAPGRPDEADREKARLFGRQVRELLAGVVDVSELTPPDVPGNFPYREGVQRSDVAPETDASLCVLCGDCAEACPGGAITLLDDAVETNPSLCVRCCACIRICPTHARIMPERFREFGRMLNAKFPGRREPEFFL